MIISVLTVVDRGAATGERQCDGCNGEMVRPTGMSQLRWQSKRFCSRNCSNQRGHTSLLGTSNPSWKGSEARPETKRRRAQRTYTLGDCEECGSPATDRHHKNTDTGDNSPSNIALLCRRCHMKVDGRMEAFIAAGDGGRKQVPATPCSNCSMEYKPLRNGRCSRCDQYWRRRGVERP